jgi:thioredoxin 1
MEAPVTITDENFAEVISKYNVVVVDFWASWCYPCAIMAPIIDEVAREYAGLVVFGKLNVDESPRTANEYGVMSIPTLLIFKGGKLVDSVVGAVPKHHLKDRIERILR